MAPRGHGILGRRRPDTVPMELHRDGEAQRLGGARVSVNFFSFLGVPVASGRGFRPEEEQPGRDRVVVISDALWRSRYGGSPTVLNSTIFLNGDSHVVVGIAPPSLLVPTGPVLHPSLAFAPRIDIWKPIAPTPRDLEGENWTHGVLVRLKPEESAERGRVQLQAMLNRSLRAVVPDLTTEFQTKVTPIREIYAGKIRLRLLLVAPQPACCSSPHARTWRISISAASRAARRNLRCVSRSAPDGRGFSDRCSPRARASP